MEPEPLLLLLSQVLLGLLPDLLFDLQSQLLLELLPEGCCWSYPGHAVGAVR